MSFGSNAKPFWPGVPIAFILPCTMLVLFGVFSDREPPPPVGELRPATVVAVDADGAHTYALVRVDTPEGPVLCGIARREFPDRRFPPTHAEITVDYTPDRCAPAPVSEELPRWVLIAMGGGGLAAVAAILVGGWRRRHPRRPRRRWYARRPRR